MKVLFICNQGQNRSKTAAALFINKFKTKSAGLYNNRPVTIKQLDWADLIVVMEDKHRTEISQRFQDIYMRKRILSLNIPDIYCYSQPELVNILNSKIGELL